ncbi:hypothetical protein CASFOL_034011 [Castilleja foliolosa]|uniref:Uncharacterized protein n=1 Tax=Castilleja foliolosa TaxID=1961234 RepID=A0ABD3C147_9LAMI
MVMVAGKSSDFSGGARAALRRWLVIPATLKLKVVTGKTRAGVSGWNGPRRVQIVGDDDDVDVEVEKEKRHVIRFWERKPPRRHF